MIITDQFVFIHLHKTGGQTLNEIITSCMPNHRVVGYHYPRSMVPVNCTALPVVGMVRNPWAWYVSWYCFNRRSTIHNTLFKVVSGHGSADFKATVRNLVMLGSDDESSRQQRDELVRLLPETLDHNRGVGLTKDDIRSFSDQDHGYFSWLTARMFGDIDDGVTLIGKAENLQHDFLAFMQRLGVNELDRLRDAFSRSERRNTSQHSHYSHYYDDELHRLVLRKDRQIIERFAYRYATVGPKAVIGATALATDGNNEETFQKLLGRSSDYLLVHSGIDVESLRRKVMQIPASVWSESDRNLRFHVHRDTESVILIKFSGHLDTEPLVQPIYAEFEDELRPIIAHIAEFYQDNGFVLRILLAKLCAGGKIEEHVDSGYSLLEVHRLHMPLITNEQTTFLFGGTEKRMAAGDCWEINNGHKHAVFNNGIEDRVHLILDWMPNRAGLSQAAAIDAVKRAVVARESHRPESLAALVDQGYALQQAGNIPGAEANYRYVLERDPDNLVCNNLMGMLCRLSRRYEEAITYIARAIAIDPNDAKSHANLGQALLILGRYEDSADSFQNALSLDPSLESALVGLQRANGELAATATPETRS
jgi:hypothetical protein